MNAFYKVLSIAAAAALTFVACTKEIEAPIENSSLTGITSFKFKANTENLGTKATLAPETDEETSFAAAWENSDEMVIESLSLDPAFDEFGTAVWDSSEEVFSATYDKSVTLPTASGDWTYSAWYPAKASVPFQSNRVQNGNAYASEYDLMYGSIEVDGAQIGKNADGTSLVIPMNRLTAIAYYHITSGLNEDVVSATLTVDEGKTIAAETVEISSDGKTITPTNGSNTITITFEDGTAPKATDFQLWFNILTENIGSASSYNVTVDIVTTGHTAKLTSKSARSFTAGKLNRAKISSLTWKAAPKYEKVTSTTDLTEGDYLIVYEADGLAFNGSLATLDAADNVASVSIVDNAIPSTDVVNAMSFHIAPYSTGYSIFSKSGSYIGQTSDANGMATGSSAYANTISFSDGNANIVSGGAYLRYNSASNQNRFRYYKSSTYTGQKAIALYKLDDGKQESGIGFATDEFTFVLNSSEYAAFAGQAATLATGNTAAVTYTISGDAIGLIDENDGTIVLDEKTVGTAVITATVAATDSFRGGSATYTVIVERAAKTFSQINAAETGVSVKDVTVMATDGGSNVILKDATGLGFLYKSDHNLSAGDYLNTLIGDVVEYNGVYEFKNNVSFDKADGTVTVDHGTAVEFSSVASNLVSSPAITYVHAIGTKSARNITVGSDALYLSATSTVADGPVEIYGYTIGYSDSHSNHTIVAVSLEPYVDPDEPILEVSTNSLTWLYNETDAKSVTITLNGNGSVTKAESGMSWATVTLEGNTLTVTPNGENSSTTQDNEGTITLTHSGDNSLVEVITCTQEKKVNYLTKTVSFTPGDAGGLADANNDGGTGTKKGVSLAISGGGNGASYINVYKGKTMTISAPANGLITEIVLTCTANGSAQYGPGSISLNSGENGTYTASTAKTGTWTGSAASVAFTANENQIRMTSIEITYKIDEALFTPESTTITLTKGETSDDPITVKVGVSVDLADFVSTNNTEGTKTYATSVASSIATLEGSVVTGAGEGGPFVVTLDIAATEDYAASETKNIYVTVEAASSKTVQTPIEIDLTEASFTSSTASLVTWDVTDFTMTNEKISGSQNANAYLGGTNNTNTRFYNGHRVTITPDEGCEITSIVFTATGSSYNINGTWTNGTASKSGSNVTVTPTDGESAVICEVTATCRLNKVTINYKK